VLCCISRDKICSFDFGSVVFTGTLVKLFSLLIRTERLLSKYPNESQEMMNGVNLSRWSESPVIGISLALLECALTLLRTRSAFLTGVLSWN